MRVQAVEFRGALLVVAASGMRARGWSEGDRRTTHDTGALARGCDDTLDSHADGAHRRHTRRHTHTHAHTRKHATQVLNTSDSGAGYELRAYAGGRWASTNVSGYLYGPAVSTGFMVCVFSCICRVQHVLVRGAGVLRLFTFLNEEARRCSGGAASVALSTPAAI